MDTSVQHAVLHVVVSNWDWLGKVLEALVLWPILSGVLTLFARRNNPAEWETWALKNPKKAALVEFARTNGPDFLKNPVVLQRYAARKAGKIPMDALEKIPLPAQLREALKNPLMHEVVTEMLRQHVEAEAAAAEFDVQLLYIGIADAQLSAARVAARVRAGGHDVPLEKILARYARTLENLARAIARLPQVTLYDNSSFDEPFQFIAEFRSGELHSRGGNPPPPWAHRFFVQGKP